MSRLAIVMALVAAVATAATADTPQCGPSWIASSVAPQAPACNQVVTLGLTLWLPDSCWTATPPVVTEAPPEFSIAWDALDMFEQYGGGCTHMVLELPYTRQVGPLPAGPYSYTVLHDWSSPRHGDGACGDRIDFDVTCCPEVPGEVADLRVGREQAQGDLVRTWIDVGGAEDYAVYGVDAPLDPFVHEIASGVTGVLGAPLPVDEATTFFVVAARNVCGVGPRR